MSWEFAETSEPRLSLRLSDVEVERLLSELNQQSSQDKNKNKRRSERVPIPNDVSIVLQMLHPGGGVDKFIVRGRNVSDHGVALLHGTFIHTDTKCMVTFRKADGESVQLDGIVRRCRYLSGGAHEVGIMFKSAFPMCEFLEVEDQVGKYTPAAPETRFDGLALLVDDCPASQRLHNYMLATLGLDVTTVGSGEAAIKALKRDEYTTMVTDIWMQPMDGFQLAAEAKVITPSTKILAVTCDERPEIQARIRAAEFAGVMEKPLKIEALVQTLKSILPEREESEYADTSLIVSSRWNEPELRPLISSFVQELTDMFETLDDALHNEEYQSPIAPDMIAREIATGAEAHGFQPLKETADELCQLIREKAGQNTIKKPFHELNKQIDCARRGVSRK